jgi:tRNA dimethylallyltransferase
MGNLTDTDTSGQVGSAVDCWYLTGPTAAGKTAVGIDLAELLGAEIISMDSMALYREMDIGTAKPSAEQRQRVPHHLLDILDPNQDFSVSNYIRAAGQKIAEIRGRGRDVVFVGGTPLYLKAMLRGLFHGPPADWEFRQLVEEEAQRVGVEQLHQRLEQVDPLSAARLHPNDKRRIVRALEVYRVTGRPISHLQQQFEDERPAECCRVFVLRWERRQLHHRINRRVDTMFAKGWVDEVRGILDRFGTLGRTAGQAVGYRELIDHVQGKRDLSDTIEAVKARTRQFARRQETWFRSLGECRFIDMDEDSDPSAVAEKIRNEATEDS